MRIPNSTPASNKVVVSNTWLQFDTFCFEHNDIKKLCSLRFVSKAHMSSQEKLITHPILLEVESLPASLRVGREGIRDSQEFLILAQTDVQLLARK